MAQVGIGKWARLFRWVACGVATLVALLHLVHLGGDILLGPGGSENVTVMNVALASLLVFYCASLLLCWKWLGIAGGMSLAFIAAFIGILLWNKAVGAWAVWEVFLMTILLLTLPSVLLLAAAWVSRAPKPAVPAE